MNYMKRTKCTKRYMRMRQMQQAAQARWSVDRDSNKRTIDVLNSKADRTRLAAAKARRDKNQAPWPLDNLELAEAGEPLNLVDARKSRWVEPYCMMWCVGRMVREAGPAGISARAMALEIFGLAEHEHVLKVEWYVGALRRLYFQPLRMCRTLRKYRWFSEYEVWETSNPYDGV